jgi:lipopolysaccharide/colanic/teichoic acid biosynthesis glycosyltransferase
MAGRVFYAQQRVGKRLQLFRILKFRTMIVGAERNGLLAAPNDQHITRVGRFLRTYKLDELPKYSMY